MEKPRAGETAQIPAGRIVAAATLAGTLLVAWNILHLQCLSPDGVHYITFAKQLSQDPIFFLKAHRSQPGYSALILLASALVPSSVRVDPVTTWLHIGQIVAAIGYVASIPLVYLLARRLFADMRIAAACAVLAAVWPKALQLGGDVLSDMPHLALYLAAVLVAERTLRDGGCFSALAAGLTGGAAYLLRQEALGVPAALMVCLWLRGPADLRPIKRRLAASGLIVCGFAIAVAPYVLCTGELLHKKSLRELLFGPKVASVLMPATHALPMAAGSSASSEKIHQVGQMLDGWARSGWYVYSTLIVIGLCVGMVRANEPAKRFVAVLIGLHCAAVLLRGQAFGIVSSRYMLIPAALTLPWAAAGWTAMIDGLRRKRDLPPARVWAGSAAVIAGICVPLGLQPINAHDAYLRKAGELVRARSEPGDAVLAEDKAGQAVFYSGLRWNQWPDRGWSLSTVIERDEQVAARWYLQLEGSRGNVKADESLIAAMLSNPRWPHAAQICVAGPPGKRIHVLQLRP